MLLSCRDRRVHQIVSFALEHVLLVLERVDGTEQTENTNGLAPDLLGRLSLQEAEQDFEQMRILLVWIDAVARVGNYLTQRPQRRVLELYIVEILHGLDEKRYDCVEVLNGLGRTLRGQLTHHGDYTGSERHVMTILAQFRVQTIDQWFHVQVDKTRRVRQQVSDEANLFNINNNNTN